MEPVENVSPPLEHIFERSPTPGPDLDSNDTAPLGQEAQTQYPIREILQEGVERIDFGNGDGLIIFTILSDTNPRYNYEWERFRTWHLTFPSVKAMAVTGFYFTNIEDRVKCFDCQTEFSHWQMGDDPTVDHATWAGSCRMVRRRPCGNVHIGQENWQPPYMPPLPILETPPFLPQFVSTPIREVLPLPLTRASFPQEHAAQLKVTSPPVNVTQRPLDPCIPIRKLLTHAI